MKCFPTESDLVEAAIKHVEFWALNRFWDFALSYCLELDKVWGVPDLLVCQHSGGDAASQINLINAFEFKLKNWRRAVVQAFRYRGYCERSYVVMDHSFVNAPLRNIDTFKRYNIGLLSLDTSNHLYIHYTPAVINPFSTSLRATALKQLSLQQLDPTQANRVNYYRSFPNGRPEQADLLRFSTKFAVT